VLPETSTAEVSSMATSLAEKAEAFRFVKAARRDSAVHVSLSSDSLVKQPGTDGLVPIRSLTHPTWPLAHGRMSFSPRKQ
jgi:hypothetical protein